MPETDNGPCICGKPEICGDLPHGHELPVISRDGDEWLVLLGENLVEGIAGFGHTAEMACAGFDKVWMEENT